MPAHTAKRDKQMLLSSRVAGTRCSNASFEAGVIGAFPLPATGEREWTLFDDQKGNKKIRGKFREDSCRDSCDIYSSNRQAVLAGSHGDERIPDVVRSVPSSSAVEHCLCDDARANAAHHYKHDFETPQDRKLERMEYEANVSVEDEDVDSWKRSLVADIRNDGREFSGCDLEDAEEIMAAAVLTSLSLSPVLSEFVVATGNGDFDSIEDGVFATGTLSVPEIPEIDKSRRTKTRRRKNSLKKVFQCTWPRCGKILLNSSAIIWHVRSSHLGPKGKDDNGFSDGEEEFYFNEIELNADDDTLRRSSEGSISPPPPPYHARRFRSMSDPSRPTQPLVSSGTKPLHVDDNFTWPLRSTGANRSKAKRAHQHAVHSNSRKGRGDGRKCRKVYGMENKHLWCTQCRWKKACIKFAD